MCKDITSVLIVIVKNWKKLVSSDKGIIINIRKVKGNMPKC